MKVMTLVTVLQRGPIAISALAPDATEIGNMSSEAGSTIAASIASSTRTDTLTQTDMSHGVTATRQGVKHNWLLAKHN